MDSYVVLSPHFDDGVLSCGGHIFAHRQRGESVRVLTIFAAGAQGDEIPPFAAEQHRMWGNPPDPNRLRRAEDIAAYARLGCLDVYHLDAPDSVYRLSNKGEPLYTNNSEIFGAIHPEEADYDLALLELVRPYIPSEAFVLAPWAIGGHVDHQLTHQVGRLLESEGWEVGYYEDVPYVDKLDMQVWEPRGTDEYRIQTLGLDEEDMEAKVAAMAYYRTQIPVLYGTEAEMRRRLRATAERVGDDFAPMMERVWWRLPPYHPDDQWNGGEERY
jgi:LmbE family N-acetylglucosaminyl deacetylase